MALLTGYVVLLALLLVVPGGVVATCLGLRPGWAAVVAPAISAALIGAGTVVLSALHLPYGVASAVVVWLLACAVAYGLRRVAGLHSRVNLPGAGPQVTGATRATASRLVVSRLRSDGWVLGVLACAAVALIWTLGGVIESPDAIQQRGDAIFHLNAVQWIVQHHDGSGLTLRAMDTVAPPYAYYPAGWHAWIGLALMVLPHTDVSVGLNASLFAELLVAWLPGVVALVRVLVPSSRVAVATAAIAAVALPAFPLRLLLWGPSFPTAFGVALLPGVLAAVVATLRVSRAPVAAAPVRLLAAAGVGFVGVALAHPSAAVMGLIWLAPLVAAWGWGHRRSRRAVVISAVALIATAACFAAVRPAAAAAWWPAQGPDDVPTGIGIVAGMSGMESSLSWLAAILVAVGLYATIRRRHVRGLALLHVGMGAVVIHTYTHGPSRLRYLLSGTWYSDVNRVGVMLVLTGIPLAAYGAWHAARRLSAVARVGWRRPAIGSGPDGLSPRSGWGRRGGYRDAAAVLASVGIAIGLLSGPAFLADRELARTTYSATDDGRSIDADERALLGRIEGIVPVGDVIATNPHNGSSLAYAVSGRRTTNTALVTEVGPDEALLNEHLREAATRPDVCRVVRDHNVRWALDFGIDDLTATGVVYPGLADLGRATGFREVARVGHKGLYRIDACWT